MKRRAGVHGTALHGPDRWLQRRCRRRPDRVAAVRGDRTRRPCRSPASRGGHAVHRRGTARGRTGWDLVRRGNRVPWAAPHDAYPAAGSDQWVAVAVLDDGGWQGLCRIVGGEVVTDPTFATLPGRLKGQDRIDVALSAWTSQRNKRDAAAALRAAGVAAASVQDAGDVAVSPFLAARRFFTTLTHPDAGTHPYPGIPIYLSRTPGSNGPAAPCLGQHTSEILSDLLGLDPAAIEHLENDGTTASAPM